MNNSTPTFEVNKTYQMNFIGDSDLKVNFKIIKRMAKSVRIVDNRTGEEKTCRINISYDGREFVYPYGRYSMSPILGANRLVN